MKNNPDGIFQVFAEQNPNYSGKSPKGSHQRNYFGITGVSLVTGEKGLPIGTDIQTNDLVWILNRNKRLGGFGDTLNYKQIRIVGKEKSKAR